MARRKRNRKHEDHVDESWLLPYADLLTLLLALFIVLFAMSSVDAMKFQRVSNAFSEIFTGGVGVMDFSNQLEGEPGSDHKKDAPLKETEDVKGKLGEIDERELSELQKRVNGYIDKKGLEDKLDTSLSNEGLLVTIRDNVLFESGSAMVRPPDRSIAKEISDLIVMDPPRSITISGYTDNVPISNSDFASNWDLSVMRAVNFMKVLLENEKLNPEWFSAKGYGEYKPVATNETAKGRAKNRRVEILIAPRTKLDK
ncbi:MAG: flagellar motor protein MotB [Bacillus sp. (in: firmicutes)]